MRNRLTTVLALALIIAACDNGRPPAGQAVNVFTDANDMLPQDSAAIVQVERQRFEGTTRLFCREYPFTNQQTIDTLLEAGWQYQGPIHNDGINCFQVLFIRPRQPKYLEDGGAPLEADADLSTDLNKFDVVETDAVSG
jgi:hypothetical protein